MSQNLSFAAVVIGAFRAKIKPRVATVREKSGRWKKIQIREFYSQSVKFRKK